MKKLIYIFVAILFAGNLSAQDIAAIKQSEERMQKLAELTFPPVCGFEKVDEMAQEAGKIVSSLQKNSALLHEYYYNLNGKTKDGNEDANIAKPTVAELAALAASIKAEGEAIVKANKLLPEATKEMKTVKNPMKLKAVKKSMDYTSDVMAIAVEENAAELELITKLIEQAGK